MTVTGVMWAAGTDNHLRKEGGKGFANAIKAFRVTEEVGAIYGIEPTGDESLLIPGRFPLMKAAVGIVGKLVRARLV